MQGKLLSIIVPAYNAECYIEKCIKSILAQTYHNIEIIIIDDGSKDATGDLCKKLSLEDRRIKYFYKENEGLAKARKTGVKIAEGEYIGFVDSDDWIDSDMYETLMHKMIVEDAEIITSGYIHETVTRKILERDTFSEGVYSREEIAKYILPEMMYCYEKGKQGVLGSVCTKVFKTELIKSILSFVDDSLALGEDAVLTYNAIAKSAKVVITHYVGYHYIQHVESMVHAHGTKDFENIMVLNECLKKLVVEYDEVEESQIVYVVGPFLQRTMMGLYGIDMNTLCCMPPYEIIPKGSKLVVYGAGAVGKLFVQAFRMGEYADIIMWVDENYMSFDKKLQVKPPVNLLQEEYDYVLLASATKEVAENMKTNLLRLGVEEEKILWKKVQIKSCWGYKI